MLYNLGLFSVFLLSKRFRRSLPFQEGKIEIYQKKSGLKYAKILEKVLTMFGPYPDTYVILYIEVSISIL